MEVGRVEGKEGEGRGRRGEGEGKERGNGKGGEVRRRQEKGNKLCSDVFPCSTVQPWTCSQYGEHWKAWRVLVCVHCVVYGATGVGLSGGPVSCWIGLWPPVSRAQRTTYIRLGIRSLCFSVCNWRYFALTKLNLTKCCALQYLSCIASFDTKSVFLIRMSSFAQREREFAFVYASVHLFCSFRTTPVCTLTAMWLCFAVRCAKR